MGNSGSTRSPPEGPIVDLMKKKHGDDCVRFLNDWIEMCGFPEGGSLSPNQLNKLRDSLQKQREKMLSKGKVSAEKVKVMLEQEKCLKKWFGESKARDRKQACHSLPKIPIEGAQCKPKSKRSSLYPCLTDTGACRWDDETPPPSNPPPQNQVPHQDHAQGAPQPGVPPLPDSTSPPPPAIGPLTNFSPALSSPAHTRSGSTYHPTSTSSGQLGEQQLSGIHQIHQMPMVQVAAGNGQAMLVFRPWTLQDIMDAAGHLPDIDKGGQIFYNDLTVFCQQFMPTSQELKRILMHKLGPVKFAKIADVFPRDGTEYHPSHHTWNDDGNAAYRQWLQNLGDRLIRDFPVRCELNKVTACKQKEDEDVTDYKHRLTECFDAHSGLNPPANPDGPITPYESHLKSMFLQGLLPYLRKGVESTCIGLEDARLSEVERHALHAEGQHKSERAKVKKLREFDTHKTQLALLQAVTSIQNHSPMESQPFGAPRGRGMNRGRRPWQNRPHPEPRAPPPQDVCFRCGEIGHWARECPFRQQSRRPPNRGHYGSSGQGRGQPRWRGEPSNRQFQSD